MMHPRPVPSNQESEPIALFGTHSDLELMSGLWKPRLQEAINNRQRFVFTIEGSAWLPIMHEQATRFFPPQVWSVPTLPEGSGNMAMARVRAVISPGNRTVNNNTLPPGNSLSLMLSYNSGPPNFYQYKLKCTYTAIKIYGFQRELFFT